jgi:DNA invertase Pin-like site-specific DNA recombinase
MTSEPAIPVVIYAAKSTEDLHHSIGGKGEHGQLEDCREMADREGWERRPDWEFTDEAFSAYHGNRGPSLAAAKERAIALAAERGRCVLLAQDGDRFARGAADAEDAADHLAEIYFALKRRGVELWTVRSRQLDPVRAALEGDRANDESARRSQATRAGLNRRKQRGQAHGGLPHGYALERKVIDGSFVSERVRDDETAPMVEDVFEWLGSGVGPGDVARKLNGMGLRSRIGRPFTPRTIWRIATNRAYVGEKGYPPLVTVEQFDRAQTAFKRLDPAAVQRRKGGRRSQDDYPLRGIVFCLGCGAPLYTTRKHLPGRERSYICRDKVQSTGVCDQPAIPVGLAEAHIMRHLEVFIGDVEDWIGGRLAERSDEQAKERTALDAEKAALALLDERRAKLLAEYERLALAEDPLARYALEPVAKLDSERERQAQTINDTEARLAEHECDATQDVDAVLDYYNQLVDLVQGRVKQARGAAELNAALHDVFAGVWMAMEEPSWVKVRPDEKVLRAEFALRQPTGPEGGLLAIVPAGERIEFDDPLPSAFVPKLNRERTSHSTASRRTSTGPSSAS